MDIILILLKNNPSEIWNFIMHNKSVECNVFRLLFNLWSDSKYYLWTAIFLLFTELITTIISSEVMS